MNCIQAAREELLKIDRLLSLNEDSDAIHAGKCARDALATLDLAKSQDESRTAANAILEREAAELRADRANLNAKLDAEMKTSARLRDSVEKWKLASENMRVTLDTAIRERDAAIAERDHWKANHDNQVAIKAALMDRPDLQDRARSMVKLKVERDEARHEKNESIADRDRLRLALRKIASHVGATVGEGCTTDFHCYVEEEVRLVVDKLRAQIAAATSPVGVERACKAIYATGAWGPGDWGYHCKEEPDEAEIRRCQMRLGVTAALHDRSNDTPA